MGLMLIILPLGQQLHAQKSAKAMKTQREVSAVIVKELHRNFGPKSIANLKRVETKRDFVGFLKRHAVKCKTCPVTAEFSEHIKVVDDEFAMKGKLTYGEYVVRYAQTEEGTDPDPDMPEPDDDTDTDGPVETESPDTDSGGCPPCGPFTCLSYWGQHIPCCDMPSY